ncbi:MAG: protein kinase [Sumerlaeia bacterium]
MPKTTTVPAFPMLRTKHSRASLAAAAALALALAGTSAARAQELLDKSVAKATELQPTPNTLLAADLFNDSTPEIAATDTQGNVLILSGLNGDALAQASVGIPLTGPIAGNFLGDDSLDLAVGDNEGRVRIFDGGTLEVLVDKPISSNPFALLPTTVLSGQPGEPDLLIVADQSGTIFGLKAESPQPGEWTVNEAFPAYQANTSFSAPAAVGSVRNANAREVVFPTGNGDIVILNTETGEAEKLTVKESLRITGIPLLMDLNGDRRDDIVLVFDGGTMRAVTYSGTRKIDRLWEVSLGADPVSDPVLATFPNSNDQLIFVATKNTLKAINPRDTSQQMNPSSREFSGISTQLTLIPSSVGYPRLAFGIGRQLCLMSTDKWFGGYASENFESVELAESPANTMAAIHLGEGDDMARLVALSANGRLDFVDFSSSAVTNRTYSPWMTRGGNFERTLRFDYRFFDLEQQRRNALFNEVANKQQEVELAKAEGEWDAAITAAAWLRSFDPLNAEYQSQVRSLKIRKHLWTILGIALLALAILGFTAYLIIRLMMLRQLETKARQAVAQGRMEEARGLYEKLYSKVPKNDKVAESLATVYVSQRYHAAESVPVYGRVYEKDPEAKAILHAYARSLMQAGKIDSKAQDIYEKALRSDFSEPPVLEYAIGLCLKGQGDFQGAGKRLRAALRGGYTRDEAYNALCDVYLATGNTSAKALPVYKHVYPTRQDDQRYLEAYLESCIDAKRTDPEVESLCLTVLEGNSSNVSAYRHLALVELQKGEIGQAIDNVKSALRVQPEDEGAVGLLAYCYLRQERTDEEALSAYRHALKFNRNDREILRMLAGSYFQAGRYDQEAVEVYNASYEENPSDVPTLRALAQTARLTRNHDMTVRAVEALNGLGQGDPMLNAQLASSYVAKGVYEPRVEKVFRDALRMEPGKPEFVAGLARIHASESRDTVESIPVYESHMKMQPDDKAIGLRLANAYMKANRYQDATILAKRLLQTSPGDEELNRLIAMANLYDNKIDQAVDEYTAILSRNPNDKEALVLLGTAFAQKARTDAEAEDIYRRAATAEAGNSDIQMALGRCFVEKGDAERAVESYKAAMKALPKGGEETLVRHLQEVLAQKPREAQVRWLLCEVLVESGRFREALEHFGAVYEASPNSFGNPVLRALDQILQRDQKNVPAMTMKGRMLADAKQWKASKQVLEEAYKLQPSSAEVVAALVKTYERILEEKEDSEVRFAVGKIHFLNQDHDKAIGCFQKTAQDYRWEAESTKMLGKCFMAKGMLDLALQEFKKLVVDEETKEILYDLAQRYETKKDLVGAKTVYRQLFAADIDYKDVRQRFEMLSGTTSNPMAFTAAYDKTSMVDAMSESAQRRYELQDELGRGAMGIVYRAKDKELEEVVALKILPDAMSNNPEAVRRFKIEARNARKLSHPNIVRIHDIGEEMGRKYISMEYVDGSDIKKKIRTEGKLDLKTTFRYGIAIADALGYAHRLQIVHRDIKPANIMLTSGGEVKITDFGIAKMLDQTGEGTMMGAVIGTPLYMSPEQVQGIPVDNRADIYAFGIMLYEFVNGKPPFTEGDLAYQHIHRDPDRPEGCPDELWEIIAKCLAKDKNDRWSKAEEIVEALKTAQKTVSGVA